MKEVVDFLSENTTIYLATSDKGEARVRPFQFQFAEDGRLWFCTSKHKEVYAQMCNDPRVELTCTSPKMVTVRVKGKVVMDDDMAVKQRIIESNGLVRSIYKTAENPDFAAFSLDHGEAFMFDFSGNPPKSYVF